MKGKCCYWLVLLLLGGGAMAAPLVAPPGFAQSGLAMKAGAGKEPCPAVQPYTADMNFPSKYEGDDVAKDTINDKAEKVYQDRSMPMRDLQRLSATVSDRLFRGKGYQGDLTCLVAHWTAWADANAMLGQPGNHIGSAVRKWTLAAVATSYLKLRDNLQPGIAPADRQRIESWLGALAEQVRKDYQGRGPDKANNHDYWAAWSVMVTAVVLDRPALFDWSYGVFTQAMGQITAEGYLPNELRRQTRALAYHSFALLPLSTMAAFAEANQRPALTLDNGAFAKLVAVVLANVDDPAPMAAKTGYPQIKQSLKTNGRLAWLAPYVAVSHDATLLPLIKSMLPLKSSMLGGDQSWLYLRGEPTLFPPKQKGDNKKEDGA